MTVADEPGAGGSFQGFQARVLSLTADLKRLDGFCERLQLPAARELLRQALLRVEDDRFQVAVVGEFKRGKSTFLNALLGREILPADILPCSATLNRVTYGLTPEVTVRFKDGREEAVAVDRLAEYVTKLTEESERTAAQVAEAVVRYPVAYCRHGVDLIDTPGLNDDAAMTEVTLSVLPQVDAAILVIMAQSPLSEFERDFLERKLLVSDLGRVLFVVNAIDRCESPEEADRLLQHISDRIRRYVLQRAEQLYGRDSEQFQVYLRKIGTPRVFGLSSRQALRARTAGDESLLVRSRFDRFERALERFLTEERGAVLLQAPLNRLIATGGEIVGAVDVQVGAQAMSGAEFDAAYEAASAELEELRRRKREELDRIDVAAAQLRSALTPLLENLERDLLNAAESAIDSFPLEVKELSGEPEKLQERLAARITEELENCSRRAAEQIQAELERGIAAEILRLQSFSDEVAEALARIRQRFVEIRTPSREERSKTSEVIAAAVAVYTGLGGIWSGYREAGIAGAATGALASYGTFLGAGFIASLLGLTFAWPAVLAVGIVSVFTGGLVTRAVFAKKRIEEFKERCKQEIRTQITTELQERGPRQLIEEHVDTSFGALKQRVQEEVDAQLDDTQGKLTELLGARQRSEAIAEGERAELDRIRAETERIIDAARTMLRQLTPAEPA